MGVQWTDEQKKVIELRNRNILVSAAAGSGKTAVLVERIIQMLTDKEYPLEVDKLLIVTFTEAAASEMKERIRNAVEKELEARPDDVHLQRQSTLIHSARITTIHSFCLSVIREHFHVIDIDPAFRIMEEGERLLLKQDVLSEVLEQYYESQDEDFLELVQKLGGTKSDKKLEEQILKLYEYSRSYPQPEKWLAQCVKNYEITEIENSIFFKHAENYAKKYIQDIKGILTEGIRICEEADGPYMYAKTLEDALEKIEHITEAKNFKEMYDRMEQLSFGRLSSKRDDSIDANKRQNVKKMMEQVRELVKGIKAYCFYEHPDEMVKEIQNTEKAIKTFTKLVQSFADAFAMKKQSKNMIDFNDMEQYALRILTEENDGELRPSSVAKEYQEVFEEVMIDEYQDSNLIQEAILTSVSRESRGQNNIFRVGDVKQSIYRFRLSRPELFMEKYETYSTQEGNCQRIDLHKNFRSRLEVLDGANFIFKRIMKKELGGIEYDDQAALYPGAEFLPVIDQEGNNASETELILLDCSKEKKDSLKDSGAFYKEGSAREMEARVIAKRIKQLLISHQVTDKKSGELRPICYKDIVILTRSVQGWSDTIAAELMEEGIPAYADSRTGYFEAYEVRVLLDYLRLLDNQKQDLPLAAVLASPIVGLNAQEMAKIRLAKPDGTFYEAAENYAAGKGTTENNEDIEQIVVVIDEKLKKKLIDFYSNIKMYREQLPYLTIHELLWKVLDETGYGLYVSAMPGGEQRKANIEMLVEKAVAFESTSYKGLFHFIRYIEQLEKYNVDYGEAGYINEQSDAVQIMSIHKSKGLEFPVVFVAGLGKKFNTSDSSAEVVMHPELGVGMDSINLESRTKVPTLIKKMIQREVMLENLGEELRILYVAMTRAKEKLILVGQRSMEALEKEEAYVNKIPFYVLSGAKNYLDWILAAIWGIEAPVEISCVDYNDAAFLDQIESASEILAEDVLKNWDTKRVYDPLLKEQLEKQFFYQYPYENEHSLKLKFTVSELKKRKYLQEESGEILIEEPEVVPLLPKFLEEPEELTGASRGSAYHKLLELLDFSREYDEEKLQETITHLCREKKLSAEMAECIKIDDIIKFLNCGAARKMQKAAQKKKLFKEQPFVLGIDAQEIYPQQTEETILIQGIIDVFWEEDGELILLDYKTDRIFSQNELILKYKPQLDYYAKALEQLLEKKVKEKIIYSFTLGKEISCK